jgi:Protein of unknown function (DUF1360)
MGHPEVNLAAWAVASVACWRLTHLLHAEAGPADMLLRLRARLADTPIGRALDCFFCLSLWVALPFVPWLAADAASAVVQWLALSGAAVLLNHIASPAAPAVWHEEDPR